ncbi:MAG: hypothetical protein R3C26_10275 [Calditrichia bacterium]
MGYHQSPFTRCHTEGELPGGLKCETPRRRNEANCWAKFSRKTGRKWLAALKIIHLVSDHFENGWLFCPVRK